MPADPRSTARRAAPSFAGYPVGGGAGARLTGCRRCPRCRRDVPRARNLSKEFDPLAYGR